MKLLIAALVLLIAIGSMVLAAILQHSILVTIGATELQFALFWIYTPLTFLSLLAGMLIRDL